MDLLEARHGANVADDASSKSTLMWGAAGSKRPKKLPPPPTGLEALDTLEGEQVTPLASPFCAPAVQPGTSHAADAPDPEQPQLPYPQQSSAERSCPTSRSAGGTAEPELSGRSGGDRGAWGAHAAASPSRGPVAWPSVPACVGSGGGSAHAAAPDPDPDPDGRRKALEPGTPAGDIGRLGGLAGGHAAASPAPDPEAWPKAQEFVASVSGAGGLRGSAGGHGAENPGPDPEAWPKAPESVASVGGAGGLVEVVGACFPVVLALYCSGVYFVLAFPFFTYVPTSGAMGERMLPKARQECGT